MGSLGSGIWEVEFKLGVGDPVGGVKLGKETWGHKLEAGGSGTVSGSP